MQNEHFAHNDIEWYDFGTGPDGTEARLFTLKNEQNMEVSITNYGGTVTAIRVPDRDGRKANVVLGFDTFRDYLGEHPYFGAIIGRYANRIAGSAFTLNGTEYRLAANEEPNHLHGGLRGFDKIFWNFETPDKQTLKLTYTSKNGEEGYPGNLDVTVTYSLNDENELRIDYHAVTDKATPVNLTNHSYFNLTGNPENRILEHILQLNAGQYTPVDDYAIPTGEIREVSNTPFDFTTPYPIGERLHELKNGYDHNYVLGMKKSETPERAAIVYDPSTGRKLETWTDKPGIQLYTGGGLSSEIGRSGKYHFQKFGGFCLETQYFPNSPNIDHFPSPFLDTGDVYHFTTIYRFSVA